MNSFKRMLDQLSDDKRLSAKHRQMLAGQRMSLERRTLAYLASEPAEIQVKNGILTAWPLPRDLEYPAITGGLADVPVPDTGGPIQGWLAVVLRPTTYHLSVLIGREMQVLKIMSPRAANQDQEWLDLVRDPICSPTFVEKEFQTYNRWSKDYFDAMPKELTDVVTAVRSEIDGALNRTQRASLRRWLAPSSNGDVVSPQFAQVETDRSLWHLFSGNLQMFETCMALGILRNHDVMLPSMHENLLQLGWDSWEAMRFCTELSQNTGFTMLRNTAGGFQWLI